MTSPRLGILCGITAEAAALGRWRDDPRVTVAIAAGRPARAESEAGRLASAGVRALLSWGIAGGLDPALPPGAMLVADGVIEPGGRPFAFDPALVAACRAVLPTAKTDLPPRPDRAGQGDVGGNPEAPPIRNQGFCGARLLAGSDAVLFTPAAKAALRRRTGAAAVDMESHRIASAARDARIPCLAVRAVSDPADRRLPALAADALDSAGRPRAAAVLGGIVRRPWDLPALIAAGRDSRKALTALARAAEVALPALLAALDDQRAC